MDTLIMYKCFQRGSDPVEVPGNGSVPVYPLHQLCAVNLISDVGKMTCKFCDDQPPAYDAVTEGKHVEELPTYAEAVVLAVGGGASLEFL